MLDPILVSISNWPKLVWAIQSGANRRPMTNLLARDGEIDIRRSREWLRRSWSKATIRENRRSSRKTREKTLERAQNRHRPRFTSF